MNSVGGVSLEVGHLLWFHGDAWRRCGGCRVRELVFVWLRVCCCLCCIIPDQGRPELYIYFVGVGRTFQGLSYAVAVDSLSSLLSSFWALHLQSFDLSSGTKDSKFED